VRFAKCNKTEQKIGIIIIIIVTKDKSDDVCPTTTETGVEAKAKAVRTLTDSPT
jgi:hypothetical protein